MKIDIAHRTTDFRSYRAARTKSVFNCTDAASFDLTADLPLEGKDWQVGVVVGPSGSGKTSIGRALWDGAPYQASTFDWPEDAPIIDAVAPDGQFDDVTSAFGQVGLGEVRAWLRPYPALSTGQKFRADLARVLAERPAQVVIDEFTSVVDRQIAKVGSQAFAKGWRRGPGQAVLLTCHYDILDWVQPDWVFDTGTHEYIWGWHQQRSPVEVEIREGGWELWPMFEPYHYLSMGPAPVSKCYVAFIEGAPVAHLAMSTKPMPIKNRAGKLVYTLEARGTRMVVLPEWQGAGLGVRLLNAVCDLNMSGGGVSKGRRMTTLFATSHPQLCAALRRDPKWRQVSSALHGAHNAKGSVMHGYGGHFRAIQGFRYVGPAKV